MPDAAAIDCPHCGKTVSIRDGERPPAFPFCCERCRLLDLGRWLDGRHAIAGNPIGPDDLDGGAEQ